MVTLLMWINIASRLDIDGKHTAVISCFGMVGGNGGSHLVLDIL